MIQRLTSRAWHLLHAFRRDTAGVMAIMVLLMIPVMVGMMGLTVDVGIWYGHKRGMQDAVDAAAMAGGTDLANGGDEDSAKVAAQADADRNGFVDATDSLEVNVPPLAGDSTDDNGSVEVILRRTMPLFFTTIFLDSPFTAEVRAVVNTDFEDEFCILGLDPDQSGAVTVSGDGEATFNCGVAVNSDDDNALIVRGTATLDVTSVTTVGGINIIGSADLDSDAPPRRGSVIDDPYDDLEIPDFSGEPCAPGSSFGGGASGGLQINGGTETIANDGITVICGGLQLTAGADVTLEPGVYIIDRGDFNIAGGSTITGTGVTIILTSSSNTNQIGSIQITGSSDVTLSAPTSDPACCDGYSGVLFYQDKDVSSNPSKSNLIAGGSVLDLVGALYFPGNDLDFTGGASAGSGCTQLIAKKVTIAGGTVVQGNCDSTGTRSVGRRVAKLGE